MVFCKSMGYEPLSHKLLTKICSSFVLDSFKSIRYLYFCRLVYVGFADFSQSTYKMVKYKRSNKHFLKIRESL